MKLHFDKLNELENEIHSTLQTAVKNNPNLKSSEAAKLSGTSPSKISKFCQKLGFASYRQYRQYLVTGQLDEIKNNTTELERLTKYIKHFDQRKAKRVAKIINKYNRIALYGFGPSLIAAEYFAYRLRLNTNKDIIATSDDFIIASNIKKNTIIIIYTATGTYRSFEKIIQICEINNIDYLIICEENNQVSYFETVNVLYLTDDQQDKQVLAYDKTRTTWFIFIEEVITHLRAIQESSK